MKLSAKEIKDQFSDVLLITGYCGSGKSTLSEKLQTLLHCQLFHTDELHNEFKHDEKYQKMNDSDRAQLFLEYAKEKSDGPFIIEGFMLLFLKDLQHHPFILMETGILLSMGRVILRDLRKNSLNWKDLKLNIRANIYANGVIKTLKAY